MSLISQRDRELAILAFENYIQTVDKEMFDFPNKREELQIYKNELLTLTNWIKLEQFKNDNQSVV